ncbi:hypothetical protein T484DRAFT_1782852, partial [Baffinella frigidus]
MRLEIPEIFFLHFAASVLNELMRVNHRYCPTLLISLDYDQGVPRRTCENTDPIATSRCVIKSFDTTGLACTSRILIGVGLYGTSFLIFIPLFKQTSPRAALMAVLAYMVAMPGAGLAIDAVSPPLLLHTLFHVVVGL